MGRAAPVPPSGLMLSRVNGDAIVRADKSTQSCRQLESMWSELSCGKEFNGKIRNIVGSRGSGQSQA